MHEAGGLHLKNMRNVYVCVCVNTMKLIKKEKALEMMTMSVYRCVSIYVCEIDLDKWSVKEHSVT